MNSRNPIVKVAFDESLKGLHLQDSTLTSVRQAAGVMGTFSGLVATLLGSEAIKELSSIPMVKVLDWYWPMLAIATFIFSIIIVFLIIRPSHGWVFHMSGVSIIEQFANHKNGPVNEDVLYEVLTGFNEENYEGNEDVLKRYYTFLSYLMFLVLVQIIVWLLALL